MLLTQLASNIVGSSILAAICDATTQGIEHASRVQRLKLVRKPLKTAKGLELEDHASDQETRFRLDLGRLQRFTVSFGVWGALPSFAFYQYALPWMVPGSTFHDIVLKVHSFVRVLAAYRLRCVRGVGRTACVGRGFFRGQVFFSWSKNLVLAEEHFVSNCRRLPSNCRRLLSNHCWLLSNRRRLSGHTSFFFALKTPLCVGCNCSIGRRGAARPQVVLLGQVLGHGLG